MKVIKKRYEAEGDECQTDEFLQPIIVDDEGRIRGTVVSMVVLVVMLLSHTVPVAHATSFMKWFMV